MYAWNCSKAVIDALYAKADQLEQRWANVHLGIDFRDRMIDRVLEFVERKAISELDPKLVARLLSSFWSRNARRDAARSAGKPRIVSLEDVEIAVDPRELDDTKSLVQRCREMLVQSNVRPLIAEAYLQQALHDDREEVIEAIRRASGQSISPETLRQWKHRHFGRIEALLRSCMASLGLDDGM